MNSEKIAISLPEALAARARSAVRKGRARSVSAYVAAAIEEKAKLDELEDLLQEMLAETGGPLSAREREIADAALGVRPQARKKRRRWAD
jgi:Arc/MetJ-type ribon-helix-helix transcriptional regulator